TRRGRRVRARGRRDTVEPCLRAPQSALPAAARAGSSENRTVCGGVTPPGLLTTDRAGSHPEGWGVTLLSHSDCSTACWTHRATHRASYVAPRWRARRGPACLATAWRPRSAATSTRWPATPTSSRTTTSPPCGPSEWSVGERELFAAFTSRLNQCLF